MRMIGIADYDRLSFFRWFSGVTRSINHPIDDKKFNLGEPSRSRIKRIIAVPLARTEYEKFRDFKSFAKFLIESGNPTADLFMSRIGVDGTRRLASDFARHESACKHSTIRALFPILRQYDVATCIKKNQFSAAYVY